jgi:hypothetical protein
MIRRITTAVGVLLVLTLTGALAATADDVHRQSQTCTKESCTVDADCAWAGDVWACTCCSATPKKPHLTVNVCVPTAGAAPVCP